MPSTAHRAPEVSTPLKPLNDVTIRKRVSQFSKLASFITEQSLHPKTATIEKQSTNYSSLSSQSRQPSANVLHPVHVHIHVRARFMLRLIEVPQLQLPERETRARRCNKHSFVCLQQVNSPRAHGITVHTRKSQAKIRVTMYVVPGMSNEQAPVSSCYECFFDSTVEPASEAFSARLFFSSSSSD